MYDISLRYGISRKETGLDYSSPRRKLAYKPSAY